MEEFEIPVVLFIFKRKHTLQKIIERIAAVKPAKIYIIADGPRNEEERKKVEECRQIVENSINWKCEITRNYAQTNRGVYANIAGGAQWVFEREEFAIFLEDDNLPEVTFFEYCRELLYRYKNNEKILWICGTNYLQKYETKDNTSYVFTKHLMPCGWASWKDKFMKFYDGQLKFLETDKFDRKLRKMYDNKKLFKQQLELAKMEKNRLDRGLKTLSWDYQMAISIRANDLYGISPKYNQIENIGVDAESIHGGNNYDNVMTKRFCTIRTERLELPLKHPGRIQIDKKYEKIVGHIILYPLKSRIKLSIANGIKKILGLAYEDSIKQYLSERRGKNVENNK